MKLLGIKKKALRLVFFQNQVFAVQSPVFYLRLLQKQVLGTCLKDMDNYKWLYS